MMVESDVALVAREETRDPGERRFEPLTLTR
jgi:hypothetical protein